MADQTKTTSESEAKLNSVELATELTIAWLGNQNVRATAEDVPAFLRQMHATIQELSAPDGSPPGSATSSETEYAPAVSVRKSLASRDHILSMIDGKPYKTLRRHLSTHGLTPESYRARYNLKSDYPMVAPSYSDHRREVAKKLGLGRKRDQGRTPPAAAPKTVTKAAAAPGRPKLARAKAAAAPKPTDAKAAPKPRGRTAKQA